jgi:hypothetical protein
VAYELGLTANSKTSRQQLWARWALVTLIGATIGTLIASLLEINTLHILGHWPIWDPKSPIAFPVLNAYLTIKDYVSTIVFAAIYSSIQWRFFLSQHRLNKTKWVLATVVGSVIGLGLSDAIPLMLEINETELVWKLISALIRGLALGAMLWWVLRSYSVSVKQWLLAYASAIVLAWFLQYFSFQIYVPLLQMVFTNLDIHSANDPFRFRELLASHIAVVPMNTINGAITGLITGIFSGPIIAFIIKTNEDTTKSNLIE